MPGKIKGDYIRFEMENADVRISIQSFISGRLQAIKLGRPDAPGGQINDPLS